MIDWTPLANNGTYTGTVEYRHDDDGFVRLRGIITTLVNGGSYTPAGAGATANLPASAAALDSPVYFDWTGAPADLNGWVQGALVSFGSFSPAGAVHDVSQMTWKAGPPPGSPALTQPGASLTNVYSVQVGDLMLGPSTNYIIHEVSGFGTPELRTDDEERPQSHGTYLGEDYYGHRTVTIAGTGRGDTPAAAVANAVELLRVWRSPTPGGRRPLRIKLPGLPVLYLNGKPRRAAVNTSRLIGSKVPFTLEYVADGPAWLSETETSAALTLPDPSVGRTYNRTYPMSYGTTTSGTALLVNAGNFPATPSVRFTGPVTDPRLENLDTGEWIQFNITLASGEYLDVDFVEHTAMLNGTASRYSTLAAGSSWFTLAPGNTSVRYIANAFYAGSTAKVTWRSAWLL